MNQTSIFFFHFYLSTFVLLILCGNAIAQPSSNCNQTEYQKAFAIAEELMQKESFKAALQQFHQARALCLDRSEEIDGKIEELFEAMQAAEQAKYAEKVEGITFQYWEFDPFTKARFNSESLGLTTYRNQPINAAPKARFKW